MISATLLLLAAMQAPSLAGAEAAMRRGDYAQASETLDRIVTTSPQSGPDVYRMLSDSWLALHQPERAAATLDRGLAAHPNAPLLQKTLGQLLFRYNQSNPRAGELLAAAAKTLPKDPEAHHYYAQWAFLNHQDEVAIAEATKVLAFPALNELAQLQAHSLLAMAHGNLNRPREAEIEYRKALAINRANKTFDAAAAFQYVTFLKQQGREDETEAIVEEIVRRAPHYGPAHLERAKTLKRDDKTAEAITEAELSLKLPGADPTQLRAAHVLLAMLYFAANKPDAAKAHQKAAEVQK